MNPASRLNDLVEFFNSANPDAAIKEAWEKYMGSASTPLTRMVDDNYLGRLTTTMLAG